MAEQIETSLELVGATAIEDKLQELGWPKLRPWKVAACWGAVDGVVSGGLFELDGLVELGLC